MTYKLPWPSNDLVCSPNHVRAAYAAGFEAGRKVPETADALSHLTAGDVSLPPAVRLKIFVADSEVRVPGEWCKAADAKDYGDRRAAAAVPLYIAAGLAEGRKVTEVWSVSSKVFSVLFATEAQADRFIASTTATMGATKNRLDILQPEPEPVSQYGSHELQALIVADLQKEPKP